MNTEQMAAWERQASVHAALADVTRLRIVEILSTTDASSSELARALGLPTNLLAHHLKVLDQAGLLARHRSEGDGRRTYVRLVPDAFDALGPTVVASARRMVFVCTANSARSHLAAALWSRASTVPATSAGTRPASDIDPRAVDAAERHDLRLLPRATPRQLAEVEEPGDLVVTVCDRAHEELGAHARLHWSIPDPVRRGAPEAFDDAHDLIAARVAALAPRLHAAS